MMLKATLDESWAQQDLVNERIGRGSRVVVVLLRERTDVWNWQCCFIDAWGRMHEARVSTIVFDQPPVTHPLRLATEKE